LSSEAVKKQVLHYVQDDKIYDKNFSLRTLEISLWGVFRNENATAPFWDTTGKML